MKTIRLAEIFKLLIHLLNLFMIDFYSLECREVYKKYNSCVVAGSLFVQDVSSVYFNFQLKMANFASLAFLKKHTFSIKVDNVTKQLESSRTLRGSLVKMCVVISVKHSQITALCIV